MSEFDRNLHSHAVATTAMAIPTATHNLACDRRPTRERCSPTHRRLPVSFTFLLSCILPSLLLTLTCAHTYLCVGVRYVYTTWMITFLRATSWGSWPEETRMADESEHTCG